MIPLVGKQTVAQTVMTVLAESEQEINYGQLYHLTCKNLERKVSRRDFQNAVDVLQHSRMILLDEDPKDRRRKLIRRAPALSYKESDYAATLTARLKDALTDIFTKEPWLLPIDVFLGTDKYLDYHRHESVKELIEKYAWWNRFSEEEAKEILSIAKATWTPIARRFGSQLDLLAKTRQEFIDNSIQVNITEILTAWIERRAVNRLAILSELRRTHASLAKKIDKHLTISTASAASSTLPSSTIT
jgi:hypothetical protein